MSQGKASVLLGAGPRGIQAVIVIETWHFRGTQRRPVLQAYKLLIVPVLIVKFDRFSIRCKISVIKH